MLYNINVKVDGDICYQQEFHDSLISTFKFKIEQKLKGIDFYGLRGDLKFIYHPESAKFEIVSFPENFEGRLNYVFETDRDFSRKYLL